MDVDVAIVGGGLAGLFTAVALERAGISDVVVLEAADHAGGVARTIRADGYALEPAAGTLLLPHPHLNGLLSAAGADTAPARESAAMRYVYTRGRLAAVPRSPRLILSPVVPWRAKVRALAEPIIRSRPPEGDESLADLLARRFGRRLGDLTAWLAASGVFAGDPRRLSAAAAFPALAALEREAGSIVRGGIRRMRSRDDTAPRSTSHVPVPDMAGLADSFAAALGHRLRLGSRVDTVTATGTEVVVDGTDTVRARHVVLACRPGAAAALLRGDAAALLCQAVAAPVAVVWLGGSDRDMPVPDGFGALFGPDAGMATIGILFESSYAPGRAPDGHRLTKSIVGGATNPQAAEWDDARLIDTAVVEASTALKRPLRPDFSRLVRHRAGIPQYEVGHADWLESVEGSLPPAIHITGWGYRGAGVAHLATDAVRVANRVAAG